jgi:hypothetical protein
MWGPVWQSFWGELNTPNAFRADPYGALTNASGHVLLGLAASSFISLAYCALVGEMPVRGWVWLVVTFGYLWLIERVVQSWSGPDSIRDGAFVSLGSAVPLVALKEVSIQPIVVLEPQPLQGLVALAAVVVALAAYVFPRARRKWRETQGTQP